MIVFIPYHILYEDKVLQNAKPLKIYLGGEYEFIEWSNSEPVVDGVGGWASVPVLGKYYSSKKRGTTYIGRNWDYSKTTGKYRNQFLREDKKETERLIKSGEYLLLDI